MTRVVCPICRTGFEANVSRENSALNCVSCGVAFNAAHFLNNKDDALRNLSDPPTNTTRTGGLPFMSESGVSGKKMIRELAAAATPLPAAAVARNGAAAVATLEPKAPGTETRRGLSLLLSKTGQPHSPLTPAVVSLETPDAVACAQMTTSKMDVAKTPVPEKDKPRRTSRRPLLEGRFGPYEIEGEIARGGVGAVFRARETDTKKLVALKVLLDGEDAGDAERERFRHECETAKALSLPGMVQVYQVGEIDNKPFMAMELVEGRSLDKIIPEKTLSVNDCLVLMKSVAETIGALHEAGYVHRDIKPGNILIDPFGSPKVADFGLIKSLDEITRLTASGLVCGTPAYMAPEQARGDGDAVDPRSDVWALGAVLYEMLTGQPAFRAENALRLMLKITKDAPKPPRQVNMKVPADVQAIVLKCLEKNPVKRYPTARALAKNIESFLSGEPLEVSRQPKMQKMFEAASKNSKALFSLAGVGAAVIVVGIVAHLLFAPGDPQPLADRGYAALNDASLTDGEKLATGARLFLQAIALNPKDARAHMGLGLCLARAGIDPKTFRRFDDKKVADGVAETAKAAELDPKLQAEAHAQIAKFNKWMQLYAGEAQEWERAVELAPNDLQYREALGMAYWYAGTQKNSAAYYERAMREFRYILQVQPEYPKVREYLKLLDRYVVQQGTSVSVVTPR